MKRLLESQKDFWTDKESLVSALIACIFFGISLIINFYAGVYATISASNSVTDLILDHIRVYDVGAIFTYGPIFLWAFITVICLNFPKRIPFVLKSIALFIIIRAVFISLTHIGPSIDAGGVDYTSKVISNLTFGGDLFFSAHTGLPFLMALIFGKNRKLFILFTLTSIFFGVIVLMGHLHYSIDVLAAFFITYTIFNISKHFFKKDWEIFNKTHPLR